MPDTGAAGPTQGRELDGDVDVLDRLAVVDAFERSDVGVVAARPTRTCARRRARRSWGPAGAVANSCVHPCVDLASDRHAELGVGRGA
jgi:hypothetical protein